MDCGYISIFLLPPPSIILYWVQGTAWWSDNPILYKVLPDISSAPPTPTPSIVKTLLTLHSCCNGPSALLNPFPFHPAPHSAPLHTHVSNT